MPSHTNDFKKTQSKRKTGNNGMRYSTTPILPVRSLYKRKILFSNRRPREDRKAET